MMTNVKDPMKVIPKISSSLPFRKLRSLVRYYLKKLENIRNIQVENSLKSETEVQNECKDVNKDWPHNLLIGIEIYMPIVDVENNSLISPKFDHPIFKFDEIDLKTIMIKKRRQLLTALKNKQSFKISDEATKNSNKAIEFYVAIKDAEECLHSIKQKFELFKKEMCVCKNTVKQIENDVSIENEQINTTTSIESTEKRCLSFVNSVQNQSSVLKFICNEKETKSEQHTKNIEQNYSKHDFLNSKNSKFKLKYLQSPELNLQNAISIRPLKIRNCTNPASSVSGISPEVLPQIIYPQQSEICSALPKTDGTAVASRKHKSEPIKTKGHAAIKKTKEPVVNKIDATTSKNRNKPAKIIKQESMHNFRHSKSAETMKETVKIPLEHYNDEAGTKRSKFHNWYHEDNVSKRHLPTKTNTNSYMISNSCTLPRKRYLIMRKEMRQFCHPITTQNQKGGDWKTIGRKQTGPNPKIRVAARKRLRQLITSDDLL